MRILISSLISSAVAMTVLNSRVVGVLLSAFSTMISTLARELTRLGTRAWLAASRAMRSLSSRR